MLLACGALAPACTPPARPTLPPTPAGPSDSAYTAVVRTRFALDDAPILALCARAELVVDRRDNGSARVTARFEPEPDADAVPAEFEVRLRRDGSLETLRGSEAPDSTPAGRTLRHVLGALSGWDDALATAASNVFDLEAALRLAASRDPGTRSGVAIVPAPAPVEIAGWRFEPRGEARIELRRTLEAADACSGRTRMVLAMPVRATGERGGVYEGELGLVTDVEARAAGELPPAPACAPPPSAPATTSEPLSRRLMREIETRRDSILECYTRELARSPGLRGRIAVTFVVHETGEVSDLRATEETLPSAIGACVIGVLAEIRFSSRPEGGPATYSFPFVFEPTD